MSRVVGLDYGERRCGCAVSDPSGTLATPLGVIDHPGSEQGLQRLAELVAEQEAGAVVVGLPVTLAGEEGAQAAETKAFVCRLRDLLDVPVETYDERFTTKLAKQGQEQGRGQARAPEHARAAAHLLTDYLRANRRAEKGRGGG